VIGFTPFFHVHGLKRTAAPSKSNERHARVLSAKTPADKLIQMLIQKGVLSEEEGRAVSAMIPHTCTLLQAVIATPDRCCAS
jgi:hypothetical protein